MNKKSSYLCKVFIKCKFLKNMKKLGVLIAIVLFAGSFVLSSCNSHHRLCPAYPPSTFHGDSNQDVDTSVEAKMSSEQL